MSPSKDRKSRKQFFDTSYNIDDIQIDDIHNFTDVFSVLDISSNADNNEFNTCISTDTFPASENQSNEVCSRNNAVLLGWKKSCLVVDSFAL